MALNYTPANFTPKPEDKPYTPVPNQTPVPTTGGGGGWGDSPASAPVINRPVITPTKEPTKSVFDFGPQSVVDNGPEGTAAKLAADAAAANKPTLGEKGLTVAEQMDMSDRQMKRGKYAETERPIIQSSVPSFSGQDEAKIREEELARQRARIDAVNQLYVDEYRKAKERATARTGTQRAQSAARGTIGSDFGTAEQAAVTDVNVGEEQAIRAKQNAEIQAIMNESDKSIQDRVAKAQALILAQQERADKLKQEQDQLAIQTGQLDLQKEKAKQDAIAAGIKPVETNDGNVINAVTGAIIYKGTPKAPTYGAGSVGEYQFYSDQEKAAGRIPMSFSDYQTADANRKAAVAGGQKIVKINGEDYVQQADGSFVKPNVPQSTQQASEIKTNALTSAKELAQKLKAGEGTSAIGTLRMFGLQLIPGTAPYNFQVQLNNLKALLSLDNVKLLKGQGQVSDAERRLLEQASSKLDAGQTEEEFKKALDSIITGLSGGGTNTPDYKDAYSKFQAKTGIKESYDDAVKQYGLEQVQKVLQEQGFNPDLSMSQNGQAEKIAAAIKQVESGGNYNAKGGSGEGGAYQFMPSTWSSWAGNYLGNPNAPQTPENQDKVAIAKINDLLAQGYTPQEIALIWNGGQPIAKKGTNKYGVAYDSGAYANKVLGALNNLS